MCHVITLIAPATDDDAVRVVMERHGRTARRIEGVSPARVLMGDERQYLTNPAGCDCGTVLSASRADEADFDATERAVRLRRKGWSEAKISRVLASMQAARKKTERISLATAPDSLALWEAVVTDLRTSLRLSHVGLLVHSYFAGIADEDFDVARLDLPVSAKISEILPTMSEDVVTVFR